MTTIVAIRDFTCVPTGAVHGRQYKTGETLTDGYVVEVALRNGWAARRDHASPAQFASVPSSPQSDPAPRRKARASAPENKAD